MKRFSLTLLFFLIGVIAKAQSQDEIITSCLTLPALVSQSDIASNPNYQILDHGVTFDFSQNLQVESKDVELISKQMISSQGYFLFHTLKIENNTADVIYRYVHSENGVEQEIPLSAKFNKINNVWTMDSYTFMN